MYTKKDFRDLFMLTKRNSKIYFKDKSAFLPSLITPLILFFLFVTFLKKVYTDSLLMMIPEGIELGANLVNSFAGSWLMSSILGVSTITIAFCSNIVMVADKVNKTNTDFYITSVKKSVVSLSYLVSNFITTFIVSGVCMIVCFIYIACIGWFFSLADVLLIFLIVVLCCLFGCVLASVIEYFINSNGGISAVATLVSSMYGFLCGAYMPLSQFSEVIRNFICLLPGTYAMGLVRNSCMNGVLTEMSKTLPSEAIETFKNGFDANLYFFGNQVAEWQMFLVVGISTVILLITYLCFVYVKRRKKHNNHILLK